MATIPSTVLGTSDPVDLCKGFALFPNLGTIRAGISVQDTSKPLFRIAPNLLLWKINANASVGIRFGICGPAYGFRLNAQGSTTGNTINLALDGDQIAAGLIFGVDLGVNIQIQVQRLSLQWVWDGWNSHIKTTWESAANVNLAIDFDLIGTILAIILYVNDESENKNQLLSKLGTYIPNLIGSYGFYDAQSGQIASAGEMSAEPAITIPINLANLIPPVQDINKLLAVLWGGIGFGPSIGIAVPTTVKITGVSLDAAEFNNATISNGTLTATTTAPVPQNPVNIGMGVQHNPNFELQAGVWAQFYILKIFQIGFSATVDILNLLGIKVSLGTYNNTVSSSVGGGINPPPGGLSSLNGPRPRVRLRPSAPVPA